jgi:predicted DNA-binding WGR domain protein
VDAVSPATQPRFVIQFPRFHAQVSETRYCASRPVQLPLFAEAASLIRVRPECNEWRFYRMEVWPDLFGGALLLRQWGRIGTEGRRRLDPHADPGAALNALARLAGRKRRRGYQDRGT